MRWARNGDLTTIDQIMMTETSSGTAEDAAALMSRAEQEAEQIVAKARFEAFRMVTDARTEAEAILAEQAAASLAAISIKTDSDAASEILAGAKIEAELIIEAAETEAASVIDRRTENLEQANAALISEHEFLAERLSSTKQLLERLEARLAQIAAAPSEVAPLSGEAAPRLSPTPSPSPQVPNMPTVLPPRAPRPSTNPQPTSVGGAAEALVYHDTPVEPTISRKYAATTPSVEAASAGAAPLDYSPSVPRPIPAVVDEELAPEERKSLYSRRSANLPSIGDSGGKDTLTAMRSMRRSIPQGD